MKLSKMKILFAAMLIPLVIYLLPWLPWLIVKSTVNIKHDIADLPHSDAALVFGGLYYENEPMSEINSERLLTATALFEEGIVDEIVVSNTQIAAEAMRNYLIDHGVDESSITIDTTAVVTEDTCVAEYNEFQDSRTIIYISQEYHLARIIYLCNKMGLNGVGFPAEELGLVERTKLGAYTTFKIRYERHRREAELLTSAMLGSYKPTLELND